MQAQQTQVQLQPDRMINIALPAAAWVEIITAVQHAPISWMRAEPLRVALTEQLQQAAAQSERPVSNGHDPVETRVVAFE